MIVGGVVYIPNADGSFTRCRLVPEGIVPPGCLPAAGSPAGTSQPAVPSASAVVEPRSSDAVAVLEEKAAELRGPGAFIGGTTIAVTDPRLVQVIFERSAGWTQKAASEAIKRMFSTARNGKKLPNPSIPRRMRNPDPNEYVHDDHLERQVHFKVRTVAHVDATTLHYIHLEREGMILILGDRPGNKYRPLGSVSKIPGAIPFASE